MADRRTLMAVHQLGLEKRTSINNGNLRKADSPETYNTRRKRNYNLSFEENIRNNIIKYFSK